MLEENDQYFRSCRRRRRAPPSWGGAGVEVEVEVGDGTKSFVNFCCRPKGSSEEVLTEMD